MNLVVVKFEIKKKCVMSQYVEQKFCYGVKPVPPKRKRKKEDGTIFGLPFGVTNQP